MEENNNKGRRGFYIALYSAVAVIALAAIAVTNTGPSEPEVQLSASPAQQELAVNQSPVRSYKETTTQESTQAQQAAEAAAEPTTQAVSDQKTAVIPEVEDAEPLYTLFDDTQEMLWPVNGPIIMDYSVETAVFDKTLEQYRTHDSICIAAAVGESVIAAADGVVTSITDNEEKGKTVAIDHGNGWCTTYSQLDNIALAEGQIVKQGDIVGCIAQPTKYGSALGSHLDFGVTLDNRTEDPKLYLKMDE